LLEAYCRPCLSRATGYTHTPIHTRLSTHIRSHTCTHHYTQRKGILNTPTGLRAGHHHGASVTVLMRAHLVSYLLVQCPFNAHVYRCTCTRRSTRRQTHKRTCRSRSRGTRTRTRRRRRKCRRRRRHRCRRARTHVGARMQQHTRKHEHTRILYTIRNSNRNFCRNVVKNENSL